MHANAVHRLMSRRAAFMALTAISAGVLMLPWLVENSRSDKRLSIGRLVNDKRSMGLAR